jgi:hypothetical protein
VKAISQVTFILGPERRRKQRMIAAKLIPMVKNLARNWLAGTPETLSTLHLSDAYEEW